MPRRDRAGRPSPGRRAAQPWSPPSHGEGRWRVRRRGGPGGVRRPRPSPGLPARGRANRTSRSRPSRGARRSTPRRGGAPTRLRRHRAGARLVAQRPRGPGRGQRDRRLPPALRRRVPLAIAPRGYRSRPGRDCAGSPARSPARRRRRRPAGRAARCERSLRPLRIATFGVRAATMYPPEIGTAGRARGAATSGPRRPRPQAALRARLGDASRQRRFELVVATGSSWWPGARVRRLAAPTSCSSSGSSSAGATAARVPRHQRDEDHPALAGAGPRGAGLTGGVFSQTEMWLRLSAVKGAVPVRPALAGADRRGGPSGRARRARRSGTARSGGRAARRRSTSGATTVIWVDGVVSFDADVVGRRGEDAVVSLGGSRCRSGTAFSTTKQPPGRSCAAALANTADLFVLRGDVHDRVEHEVDEIERSIRGGGQVADRHGDVRAVRLGPQPLDHRRGQLDAVHGHPRRPERQGDRPVPIAELQRRAAPASSASKRPPPDRPSPARTSPATRLVTPGDPLVEVGLRHAADRTHRSGPAQPHRQAGHAALELLELADVHRHDVVARVANSAGRARRASAAISSRAVAEQRRRARRAPRAPRRKRGNAAGSSTSGA